MAPGAISQSVGMLAGGIAETLGASASFAGAIGGAVATALPWVGAALLIGSALGLFGGKPSNKAAGGSVDLATGSMSDMWAMSGDKAPSQQTLDARTALLQSIGGFSGLLGSMGGTSSIGNIGVDVGERDGIQFIVDGQRASYGEDPDQALAKIFKEIVEGTSGLEDSVKNLLLAFDGTGGEMALFAQSVGMLSEYLTADPVLRPNSAAAALSVSPQRRIRANATMPRSRPSRRRTRISNGRKPSTPQTSCSTAVSSPCPAT
jgi:hypothetical protein